MKSLFVLLFALSLEAHAAGKALVFVNLNYSRQEFQTLSQLATQFGETLYVVPPLDSIPGGQAEHLISAENGLVATIRANDPSLTQQDADNIVFGLVDEKYKGYLTGHEALLARIKPSADAYVALRGQVIGIENSRPPVAKQLQDKIAELKQKGEVISDVVFSGHSDGSSFFGNTSIGLSDKEVAALKLTAPSLFQEPSHLLLLGCYSNTELAHKNWRSLFPNASLIGGFSSRSPAGTSAVEQQYIKETLATATRLDAGAPLTKAQIESTFNSLASFNATSAAIEYCGHYFAKEKGKLSCDEQWLEFYRWSEHFDVYNQYTGYYNHPPAQDPPKQVDGTPIRTFYSNLQSLCDINDSPTYRSQAKYWNDQRLALRDSLLRIIFWWNVQKCFAAYHKKNIPAFQQFLQQQGIALQVPRLDGNTGRKEFVAFYMNLIDALEKKNGIPASQIAAIKTDEERKALDDRVLDSLNPSPAAKKFFTDLYNLYYLNSDIPSNWAEMDSRTTVSE